MAGVEIPSDWTGEEKVGGWAGEGRKMGGGGGWGSVYLSTHYYYQNESIIFKMVCDVSHYIFD